MSKRTTRLNITFWLLDMLYLAAGLVMIIVAEIFKMSDGNKTSLDKMTLRRLVFSDSDFNGAIFLGGLFCASWIFSIPGFILSRQSNGRRANTGALALFNWTLVFTGLGTIIVGIAIWFFTLRERVDFLVVWNHQPTATQAFLQDTLQCCGYFNATSAGAFTVATGFCASVTNVTANPCFTPITKFADNFLNNMFSSIFGFMAVQACLFLCTVCLINDRHEEARYRLIDEKRGMKGGFV